jgi:hypothetical protein
MAISQSTLRSKAAQYTKSIRTAQEARAAGKKTIFLCHSHKDEELVKGLVKLLAESGWDVYVDWLDETLPDKPSSKTADSLKQKIIDASAMMFLATQNSMASRWCPWEIGYGDAKKTPSKVFIVPTSDSYTTHGSEYLELYPHIDISTQGNLCLFQPGATSGVRISSVQL